MRTHWMTPAAVSALLLAGCFNVNVEAPQFGNGGGGNGKGAPSQLPAGNWDTAQGVMGAIFGAEQGLLFYAFDTLAYPNEPVDLSARVTTPALQPITGATIAFYDAKSQPLGSAVTDDDGTATIPWTAPKAGNFAFSSRIVSLPADVAKGKDIQAVSAAPLLVAARPKNSKFVVIDLDHTVVASSFWRVLLGGGKPADDSVRVTKRIAGKYNLIYLTHRPDLLTRKSKDWLTEHGYPPAPLLVSTVKSALGGSGEFKTAKLKEIMECYPAVEIGIGDKISDAQAYVDNGLIAYLLPHYDEEDSKEMRKLAKEIRSLRDGAKIQVVSDWRQIEAGMFGGRRYAPKAFADSLVSRAAQIDREREAEKKREKQDDDDDD